MSLRDKVSGMIWRNGGVGRKRTRLHLADELLVEETAGLLVKRAVDGDNVTLCEHLLEVLDATAANLLLLLSAERLVVEVEELLAVERLQAAEDTLADAADGNGADDLALKIELVLGRLGDVPVSAGDLLAGRAEVADESEDGHDNVLGDGDDVGAGDFGDGDAAVGLVGLVEVDVVRANTGGNGDLEVLALLQAFGGEVTGVEAELIVRICLSVVATSHWSHWKLAIEFVVTYGVVMMTSASTISFSKTLLSPSLSEVVTRVCPWSSSHLRIPSSFSVVPRRRGSCLACSLP
jgi:hypothetical protein